jgi:[calcium/calmodulin-dependent protein kinase] kinase
VTRKGTDKLLTKEENVSNIIEPPTDEELNRAITAPIRHLFFVVSLLNFSVFLNLMLNGL